MCEYVNENWTKRSALHLAAYVLWKMNWIHPFADGNGRTARAVSYVVLSIKLDSLLPGTPTIPEQIASDKTPYYKALESADKPWAAQEIIDVSELEKVLDAMLSQQLINAAREASGEKNSGRSVATTSPSSTSPVKPWPPDTRRRRGRSGCTRSSGRAQDDRLARWRARAAPVPALTIFRSLRPGTCAGVEGTG
jgi:hypothetical protein